MTLGPQIVCAGCGEPTTINKPICARCQGVIGVALPKFCALCEAAIAPGSEVVPADESGVHRTRSGGYAGRCARILPS